MFCNKIQLEKIYLKYYLLHQNQKKQMANNFDCVATKPSTNSTVVAIALGSVFAPLYN